MDTDLVRVKTKYQVTLPVSMRKKAALQVGDFLKARMVNGIITFVPQRVVDKRKAFIDAHIAEGLKDIAEVRTYGPYENWDDLITSLHQEAKKFRTKRGKRSVR